MEGKRWIRSLALKNILSFGIKGVEIDLQPLNILIGPNGSGKSNFLEVFRLLAAVPTDLTRPFIRGGGFNEWLWKGNNLHVAQLRMHAETLRNVGDYFHTLNLLRSNDRFYIGAESITHRWVTFDEEEEVDQIYTYLADETAHIRTMIFEEREGKPIPKYVQRTIGADKLKNDQSILAQRNDPDAYPDLNALSELYDGICHYADTSFGRETPARKPQQADLDQHHLNEDGSNLALVLNDLQNRPATMRRIIEGFQRFNPIVENIITRVSYGTVQIYVQEKGLVQTIPATRLSDGTLRYLYLLVLLCHPKPPPLICLEEPELGMHPDAIRGIAEMLIEASKRTQLIITTHSDLLVSALSEVPEAVIVCERDEGGTTMRRLDPDKLNVWLERYSLGELWLKGEIGGTRW